MGCPAGGLAGLGKSACVSDQSASKSHGLPLCVHILTVRKSVRYLHQLRELRIMCLHLVGDVL